MFDYHMHSLVSFDGKAAPADMLAAAEKAGMREICFTEHRDYFPGETEHTMTFDPEKYQAMLGSLKSDRVKIRLGMEFGMLPDNRSQFREDLKIRDFDFVLGSVHYADGFDVYDPPYWVGRDIFKGENDYLEDVLACVRAHDDFDVLGHLTYISKVKANPVNRPVSYEMHKVLIDEILRTLVKKEKGMEMNTSGVNRCGDFLPGADIFLRFRDLGGRIVTVGSDAHNTDRAGQDCLQACRILKDIFGYVCTFEKRRPVFHEEIE